MGLPVKSYGGIIQSVSQLMTYGWNSTPSQIVCRDTQSVSQPMTYDLDGTPT